MVLAVVLLGGSLLGGSLVGGVPVGAANSAGEWLVDSDRDGRPDSRGFAGRDRYETALLLARHFADGGVPGSVDAVIVASGESQIDAVAAAGLAGYVEAPVILTYRDRLPRGVAEFVDAQRPGTVYVAGGPSAVSDAVVARLEGLASRPRVRRVAGADRYATAAAMAKMIRPSARWCESDDEAVLLANGDRVPFTSAVLAGPLSYQMQTPLLLTAADRLPAASAEFIRGNGIDRVVIIGDKTEVSDAVADEAAALGARVDRYAGADAAATSVRVAELMWEGCGGLRADRTHVALVSQGSTADGVAAGPVLGRGIGRDDRPAPILLVGKSLPGSVRDWLAGTPTTDSAGSKTHLAVVAVGGTAAVSAGVVTAAVDAAGTAPALSARISFDTSERSRFTLTFSDRLRLSSDALSAADRKALASMVYVNGSNVEVNNFTVNEGYTAPDACSAGAGTQLLVLLPAPPGYRLLQPGDRVELRPNRNSMLGAGGDRRMVQAASAVFPALPPPASVDPTPTVVAVEGQTKMQLYLDAYSYPDRGNVNTQIDGTAGKISVTTARFKNRPGPKVKPDDGYDLESVGNASGFPGYNVNLVLAEAYNWNPGEDSDTTDTNEAAGSKYFLRAGDTVTVDRGALTHTASRTQSRFARTTVSKRVPKFAVTSVRVGRPDTGVNDDPADDAKPGGLPAVVALDGNANDSTPLISRRALGFVGRANTTTYLHVRPRWDGYAAGALGNEWTVRTLFSPDWDPNGAQRLDVDVNKYATGVGGQISVTFVGGSFTLGDVYDILRADKEFAANFDVYYPPEAGELSNNCNWRRVRVNAKEWAETSSGTAIGDQQVRNQPTFFGGGVSSVGIEITFGDWVADLPGTATGQKLRDQVLAALVPGHVLSNVPAGFRTNGEVRHIQSNESGGDPVGRDASMLVDMLTHSARPYTPANHDHYTAVVSSADNGTVGSSGLPTKTFHVRVTTRDPQRLPGLRTGAGKGVVSFGGEYWSTTAGTLAGSPAAVAYSYLWANGSDQAADTSLGVPGRLPAEIDDDRDGAADKAKTATSEPADYASAAGRVRAVSGDVPSLRPGNPLG